MRKKEWSKTQIILLIGLIITFISIIPAYIMLFKNTQQQVIINQDLTYLKGKIGEFEQIITTNISTNKIQFTCANNSDGKHAYVEGDGEIGVECQNGSIIDMYIK